MFVHLEKQVQIKVLLFNKVFTKILAEYFNYSNIFLAKNVAKLLKNLEINKHIIEL